MFESNWIGNVLRHCITVSLMSECKKKKLSMIARIFYSCAYQMSFRMHQNVMFISTSCERAFLLRSILMISFKEITQVVITSKNRQVKFSICTAKEKSVPDRRKWKHTVWMPCTMKDALKIFAKYRWILRTDTDEHFSIMGEITIDV